MSQTHFIEPINPLVSGSLFTFNNANQKQVIVLPEKYDLRELNLVSSVKDKSACGCCWAFATMASLESRWLKIGIQEFNLSEQNLRTCNGFYTGTAGACEAGNIEKAIAYLTRGDGPIDETLHPYNPSPTAPCIEAYPVALVPEARLVPKDANLIKQSLMDYGALFTSMYFHDDYFNATTHTYKCTQIMAENHGVTLVGWDDNLQIGSSKGAWIVKNDFGTSWGDNGFFYIAYADAVFPAQCGYFPTRYNFYNSDAIYQYDELGFTAKAGYGTETAYSLVKLNTTVYNPVRYIGTYIHTGQGTVEVDIYSQFTNNTLSGLLAGPMSLTADYPGYYLLELPNPLGIEKGNQFYVRVKYTMPSSKSPIPVEKKVVGYAEPLISNNSCWISNDGKAWWPLGASSESDADKIDVCIKAYTMEGLVSASDVNKMDLNVYPNPSSGIFEIQSNIGDAIVEVFQLNGNLVVSQTMLQNGSRWINISNQPSGLYVLRVISGNSTAVRKIILQK